MVVSPLPLARGSLAEIEASQRLVAVLADLSHKARESASLVFDPVWFSIRQPLLVTGSCRRSRSEAPARRCRNAPVVESILPFDLARLKSASRLRSGSTARADLSLRSSGPLSNAEMVRDYLAMVQCGAQSCTVLHGDWRGFLTSVARREADVSERGCHARQASKAAPAVERRTANRVLEPVVSFSVSVVAILPCMGAALPQPGFPIHPSVAEKPGSGIQEPCQESRKAAEVQLLKCLMNNGHWLRGLDLNPRPVGGTSLRFASDPAAAGL